MTESSGSELDSILDFLQIEVESREKAGNNNASKSGSGRDQQAKGNRNKPRPASAVLQTSAKMARCNFCDSEQHTMENCTAPIDLERKKRILSAESRCFRCTLKGHRARDCRKRVVCSSCKGKHVTSLCDPNWNSVSGTKVKTVETTSMYAASSGGANDGDVVLLQTFRAWILAGRHSAYVRGVFDGGSQKTFVRQDVSRRLNLEKLGDIVVRLNTFGDATAGGVVYRQKLVQVKLRSQYDQKEHLLEAVEIPFISKDIVSLCPDDALVEAVRAEGGHIADEVFFPGVEAEPGIGLLIGADQMWKLLKTNVRRCASKTNTVAVDTHLGWTFQGPAVLKSSLTEETKALTCVLHVEAATEESAFDLRKFWELESLGITDNADDCRHEENTAMKQFESTVTQEDGRYKVGLPWKDTSSPLEDNREVAEHRLTTLVKRLRRNYSHLLDYGGAMRKYLEQGHAEVVTDLEPPSSEHVYYMPHQAVIRESSTTTKLRVVFDASAHAPKTAPLNAHLEKGPKLNTELIPLLLRFRTERIALVADIAQAFLQVVVREEDRDALRFLWYKETPPEEGPVSAPEVWRMTRVPFGTTSSPFLLAATLLHHLNGVEEPLKATASKLAASFYVDDLLTGASCEEDAQRIYAEANTIMRSAGMTLRKWASNSERLNQLFEEQEEVGPGDHDTGVLGLRWDRQTDSLKLAQHNRSAGSESPTKRTILQVSASVFDPLGFAAPFTIGSRILFQRIWQVGVDWDEDLPVELVEEWARWLEGLPYMQCIEIPRFVSQGIGDVAGAQVHVFTDASLLAYGAVAYFRTENTTGDVSVTLMISKARVAPLKTLTLPRLELMGALVGCRLAKVIRNSFTDWPLKFYFWTDSSIVLQWIKGSALRWKQFVRNRVTEVQTTTDPASWRHCPGEENPADLLTRGEKMQRLSNCKKWLKGPEWLIRTTESWPNSAPKKKVEDEELEAERVKTQVLLVGDDSPTTSVLNLENYSRLRFVLRITAWVYRFVNNCQPKAKKVSGPLTAEEIQRADLYWIRETQKEAYNAEIQQLRRGDVVDEKSPIAELRPVLDGDNTVRISSRLQHASLSTTAKHPILLPNEHRLAELVVEEAHLRLLQDTMTEVRDRYWIPRCRQLVKNVIHRCIVCRRFKARPASAPVAPLPADRVRETGPFDVIGIDFAGPLLVKSPDGGDQKAYIALFTCAVTRAVHLELVTTMSTASFLLAFRRFTARRGVPSVIYTDNALTFKKADREIWKALRGPSFQDHLSGLEIHWKYIVERAPWWGGFWERLVRVVKNNLKRTLGKNRFSFEELTTILHGVEAIVNSRPLTSVADSPDEAEPLTPAHFLVGKRVTSLPSFSESAPKPTEDLRARWKQQQLLLDRFWKRWREEYLLQLRSAHMAKASSRRPALRVGDLVIVHNEKLPRHLWGTGRITEVFPGRDKNIRACPVRLSDKTVLHRPVQLLYPLEIC